MGVLMMGSQGGSSNNGKQLYFQPLTRQNSMYSLTLDEVQNQLGDLGKPLSCMNLDELLKNVWTAEANQSVGTDMEGMDLANQTALQRQASLTLTGALSKKTVDEVWRDIQQSKNNGERKSREQQPTLGEMTLEDFLVKAGVVAEAMSGKKGTAPVVGVDPNFASQIPPQGPWMQYSQPQYQAPQQSMMGVYMPSQSIPPSLHIGSGLVMDVSYPENQVVLHSPLMGTLSDTQTSGRKRGTPGDMIEKTVERRQKRMIKNRESAARSRARKQAYTNELENKVSRLEEENERLRKQKIMCITNCRKWRRQCCHVNHLQSQSFSCAEQHLPHSEQLFASFVDMTYYYQSKPLLCFLVLACIYYYYYYFGITISMPLLYVMR